MMIIDLVKQNSEKECCMPLKRRAKKGTFGERVKECREENTTYTQSDFIEILKSRYGISMSAAAFSKIELGETRRLDPSLIIAIAEIALTNVHYLITGVEPESPTAWSEEAEQVARLIDQMLPRSKQLIKTIAHNLLTIDNEQREVEVDIAVLLQENLNLHAATLSRYWILVTPTYLSDCRQQKAPVMATGAFIVSFCRHKSA